MSYRSLGISLTYRCIVVFVVQLVGCGSEEEDALIWMIFTIWDYFQIFLNTFFERP